MERLHEAWERCRLYMEGANYCGYDPYDGLLSPVWRLPVLRSWRFLRRVGQQVVLRSPVNLRPLLRVPKGCNPVTLGLALEGYVAAWVACPERRSLWEARARWCMAELQRLRSPGWAAAWGYDFPWEARRMSLPALAPTVVATGVITTALFRAAAVLGDEQARRLCLRAATELLERFPRSYDDGQMLCWAYSPWDTQQVLNANLMGARLCAQAFALSGEEVFRRAASSSVRFVLAHQRADGAFPYAVGDDPRQWVDHLHTGYVLECLHAYRLHTGDETLEEALTRGWHYYRRHLFTDQGLPRMSAVRTDPLDASVCAQAIRTLCRFGDWEAATAVARWSVDHLQRPDGAFAYRRHRLWVERTVFMRWSVAWMFAALAELFCYHAGAETYARLG